MVKIRPASKKDLKPCYALAKVKELKTAEIGSPPIQWLQEQGLGIAIDYGVKRQKATDGTSRDVYVYQPDTHLAFLKDAVLDNSLFPDYDSFNSGINSVQQHFTELSDEKSLGKEIVSEMLGRGGYSGVIHQAAVFTQAAKEKEGLFDKQLKKIQDTMFEMHRRDINVSAPATIRSVKEFVAHNTIDQLSTMVRCANSTAIAKYANLPIRDRRTEG
ncbi:MAG: hypothetical protein V1743_03865 [Nanoarchaeota archaeon]